MHEVLDHLEEWLIAFLMGAATLLIFVAVVHRYAAGLPIPGVQDALLKIDLSLGAGALHLHVRVDGEVRRRLRRAHRHPRRRRRDDQPAAADNTRKLYVLFGLLAGAAFTTIVGTLGATFVWDIAHTDSVSPDLEVPKWIVYLCIPLGSYLMCFRFLQVAWSFCAHRRAAAP